ncbi:hypothetical protein O3M35_011371 [Rhynocoris fuscipes]|uniref:Uncharacterized protein n=1 Tax=Rhynocoris fuscipes TaxID=488301 RepID=A0AAW1CVI5_9HEMI
MEREESGIRISRLGDLPLFIHRPRKVIRQYDIVTNEHEATGPPQVLLEEEAPVIEEAIAIDEVALDDDE